jgi:hypothetical protein
LRVPKIPRGKKSISVAHIHELQNWGLDTFSPEVRDIHWSSVKENNWLNAHVFEQIQSNGEMYQILKYASVAAVYPL